MTAILAIGFVLVFEGLVLALAPSRIEDMLRIVTDLSVDQRRMIGLAAVAFGVLLVWTARGAIAP